MLSYRHAYHAGNHADVLKHFVQVQLHLYMNQKDVPYTYIDTHSGAGVYALDGAQASKNSEYNTGIGPLWNATNIPAALAPYLALVKGMNPSGKMRYYPGSPYVADQLSRAEDRLRLFELHPSDCRILAQNFRKVEEHKAEQGERARGRRVLIEHGDGFQSLKKLLPPPSRRALVLVDPPYEIKDDYKKVREALDEALGRFPAGIYAVWYPVLQRMESRQFADRLKRLPAKEWLNVTLTVSTPGPDGFGLASSGMFILNPPYTLEPMLRETLPWLVQVLGKDAGARFTIETGTQVTGAAARMAADGPRVPVGNARRASPLSGKGSLRLPGQSMVREGEEDPRGVQPGGSAPAAAKTGARRVWHPDGGAQSRPQGQGTAGATSKRPVAPAGSTGLRTSSPRKDGARPGGAGTGGPRSGSKSGKGSN
ncbi:23S rRNA (adenine(2030)-N(6))-methyltransferase RlmJ [Telluria aromaticivorans]|uniref:Ribosomal RNA large subunit methyltransferase J n=1 Tax=Telluria aromaticivorans TaxID=2725995 RepID=A0A7Y2JW63_9BURK|nr:23S rRNA (adenine(2030)-N(6))-methyltransferase RlmJ [Telluria aromaticivorans]NNG22041.1 23S rRNA (adenine(2030)-N(6))-methyltransferase RlmJ [Telluria aromaticivorans]